MSIITYIDYYVPEGELFINELLQQISSEELPAPFDNKKKYKNYVQNILKIDSIRIEKEKSIDEMVFNLIDKALDNKVFTPEEINLIIIAQDDNSWTNPDIGHLIQKKYKMLRAHPIKISGNQCINIELAWLYSKYFQTSNKAIRNVLIISATRKPDIQNRILSSYSINGDGAGIILIRNESENGIEILDHAIVCSGLINKREGERTINTIPHCNYLYNCINELVKRRGVNSNNINKVIIQNANPMLAEQCLCANGFKKEHIFDENLGKYGHLDQLDFLVNLHDCLEKYEGNMNNQILTVGFGYSGTYLSMLLEKK